MASEPGPGSQQDEDDGPTAWAKLTLILVGLGLIRLLVWLLLA